MKRTSKEELADLLRTLGVGRGDRLCVHAFVPSLGIVEGGVDGITEVLRQAVGDNGTLIVPAFTASYRRGEVYDVAHSRSFNGIFTEHLRKLDGAVRSLCPLFSMAALGPDAERLMARPNKNCFGKGSVYDALFRNDIKFVGFGVHWDHGFSFFMHLERLAEVPYRRDETFSGTTRLSDGREIADTAIHFARREDTAWRRRRGPLCRSLVEQGIVREVVADGCPHRLFEAAPLRDAVLRRVADDPWAMTDCAA